MIQYKAAGPGRFTLAGLILTSSTYGATPDLTEAFAVHGQFTYVEQETAAFAAPYSGPNSLKPDKGAETTDATLYLGARLWRGAELWINPELDQGFGLDDTVGVAGFPSADRVTPGVRRVVEAAGIDGGPVQKIPARVVRIRVDGGHDCAVRPAHA